jgi:hypothetical protein
MGKMMLVREGVEIGQVEMILKDPDSIIWIRVFKKISNLQNIRKRILLTEP